MRESLGIRRDEMAGKKNSNYHYKDELKSAGSGGTARKKTMTGNKGGRKDVQNLQRVHNTRKRGEKQPEPSVPGLIFIIFAIVWLPLVQMGTIHLKGSSGLIIGISALVIGGILSSVKAMRSSMATGGKDGKGDVLYYNTEIGTIIGFAAGLLVAVLGDKSMLPSLAAGVVVGGVCGWLFGYTRRK